MCKCGDGLRRNRKNSRSRDAEERNPRRRRSSRIMTESLALRARRIKLDITRFPSSARAPSSAPATLAVASRLVLPHNHAFRSLDLRRQRARSSLFLRGVERGLSSVSKEASRRSDRSIDRSTIRGYARVSCNCKLLARSRREASLSSSRERNARRTRKMRARRAPRCFSSRSWFLYSTPFHRLKKDIVS